MTQFEKYINELRGTCISSIFSQIDATHAYASKETIDKYVTPHKFFQFEQDKTSDTCGHLWGVPFIADQTFPTGLVLFVGTKGDSIRVDMKTIFSMLRIVIKQH